MEYMNFIEFCKLLAENKHELDAVFLEYTNDDDDSKKLTDIVMSWVFDKRDAVKDLEL